MTFAAATANPIAAIGAVAEAAKWVLDVYEVTYARSTLASMIVALTVSQPQQHSLYHGIHRGSDHRAYLPF